MPKPLKAVLVTVLVLVLVTLSGSLAAPAVARDQDRCSHRTECTEGRSDRGNGPARPFRLVAPEPTGAYDVGRTTLHLVDADRRDPWRPNDLRELMATVTYPARHTDRYPRARWFSAPVAADLEAQAAQPPLNIDLGPVDLDDARANAHTGAPVTQPGHHRGRDWPVVLFSPGGGTSRELNTALVEDLASRGYVVVSFDHTYEAPVELPDGRVVPPAPEFLSTDVAVLRDTLARAIDVRVADTRFVLDKLAELDRGRNPDAEHRRLPTGLRRSLDLSRVGMLGYSYGGYTAAEAMHDDPRIDAGINLDGTMAHGLGLPGWPYAPGRAVQNGLDRPFMLVGNQRHNHLAAPPDAPGDLSWPQFWANHRGWKLDISLRGSEHGSFADLQSLAPQIADALDLPTAPFHPLIGTIDPDRSIAAQRAYITAFFDLHLRGRDTDLLDRPSRDFPEVQIVD